MTVKEFFRSKSFRCIAVLLCVLLFSGIILTVAYGFLEVTDEERFARKINAMYDGDSVTATEQDLTDKTLSLSDATVQRVWLIEEKNDYLVQAASRGYGGDITCWIAVSMDDTLTTVEGIRKVIKYNVADSAELIGNVPDSVYDNFTTDYIDGKQFGYGDKTSDDYIATGASYSMTAVCNCVNGAVEFVKSLTGDAAADPYEGLTVPTVISKSKTSWSVADGAVEYSIRVNADTDLYYGPEATTFAITVNKADGVIKITAYTTNIEDTTTDDYLYGISETAKNLVGATLDDINTYLADGNTDYLVTGATGSNTVCYTAAQFALENYEAIIQKEAEQNE